MQMTTTCSAATGGLTISLSSLSAIWVEEISTDFSFGLRKGITPAGTPNMMLPQRVKCCRPAGQPMERSQPCPKTQCASVRCVSLGQSWPRELLPTEAFQLRSTLLSQGPVRPRGAAQGWARVGCHAQLCRAQDWEADWVVPGVPQAGIKPKPLPQCACICVSSSGLASPALGLSSCLGWCLCVHMSPKSSMLAKCSIAVGMGNSGFGGQL